jgi:diacylglycerol kinase (ATP)
MLAKEFGIPRSVEETVRAVVNGETVPMDAGRWNDRLFLCVAGVGFDAEVARRYGLGRKGRKGYSGYVLPLLGTLLDFRAPDLSLEVDGRTRGEGNTWALVANTRVYGGPLRFALNARPDSRALELCLAKRGGTLSVLRYLGLALVGKFHTSRTTGHIMGRRITVRPAEGAVPVQLDGDFAGVCTPAAPAEFEVLPAAIGVRRARTRNGSPAGEGPALGC